MKTIFVTGGCGFVGSHICLNLLESGYSLIVLDSNVNSSIYSLPLLKLGEVIKRL